MTTQTLRRRYGRAVDPRNVAAGIDFHLDEISAWRSGDRGTLGGPSTGAGYAGRMLDAIKRHEEALVLLGHEPTIDYVRLHGWADGQRGPARIPSRRFSV